MSITVCITMIGKEMIRKKWKEMGGQFKKMGMTFGRGLRDGELFFLELRESPDVLTRLEGAGYFSPGGCKGWTINYITDYGITLYICHPGYGDGFVFIPYTNIVAIHTIEKKAFSEIRRHRHPRHVEEN